MPVTGTFAADFADFNRAVTESTVKLVAFESGGAKVATSLSKMTDAFSGRKVVQEATLMAEVFTRAGSAARFTTEQLQKMGEVGRRAIEQITVSGGAIPAQLQSMVSGAGQASSGFGMMKGAALSLAGALGVTFSVQALVNYTKHLLDVADHLVKVSDATGLTIADVQRLEYAAGQTGTSVDTITAAISKMQLNLNNPAAQAAFRELNINFATLRAASPHEQFAMIAAEMGNIVDPAKRAELAVAIFAKAGIEILPTLTAEYAKLAKEATITGDAAVRAAEAGGDALTRQKDKAEKAALGVVGAIALIGEKYGWLRTLNTLGSADMLSFKAMYDDVMKAAGALGDINLAADKVASGAETYRAKLDGITAATDNLTTEQKDLITTGDRLGQTTSQIAADMDLSVEAVGNFTAALKAQATAQKALATEQKAAAEARAKVEAAGALATLKIWEDVEAAKVAQSGTAREGQIAAIEATFAKEVAAIKTVGEAYTAHYAALDAQRVTALAGLGSQWATIVENSREAKQELADLAKADFEKLITSGKHFERDFIDSQRAAWHKLQDAARGYGGAIVTAMATARAEAEKVNAAFMQLNKIAKVEEKYSSTYDSQAEVDADTSLSQQSRDSLTDYFSRQRKAEAPRAAQVGPGPTTTGGAMTNIFHVNGTSAEVAKKIEAELVRSRKLQGIVVGRR